MLHGAGAFRAALEEKLVLAARIHAGLERLVAAGSPVEIVAPPQLSILAWRMRRLDAEPLAAWNARNAAWLDAINARHRVYLSSTALPVDDGAAFTLRACVLSFRTHADRVDALLEDLEVSLPGPS
jgi:aromatic-L-amino-acid decarboxylase